MELEHCEEALCTSVPNPSLENTRLYCWPCNCSSDCWQVLVREAKERKTSCRAQATARMAGYCVSPPKVIGRCDRHGNSHLLLEDGTVATKSSLLTYGLKYLECGPEAISALGDLIPHFIPPSCYKEYAETGNIPQLARAIAEKMEGKSPQLPRCLDLLDASYDCPDSPETYPYQCGLPVPRPLHCSTPPMGYLRPALRTFSDSSDTEEEEDETCPSMRELEAFNLSIKDEEEHVEARDDIMAWMQDQERSKARGVAKLPLTKKDVCHPKILKSRVCNLSEVDLSAVGVGAQYGDNDQRMDNAAFLKKYGVPRVTSPHYSSATIPIPRRKKHNQ
ncbi:ORF39 [Ranid herpesvirus 2]|uniref:ORF39 n=1 Tax=Ranid herpesvirus 2 TaxID=389214 RepID=Q14W67_9VIRU|nr:ORF39 [Ranid herpesvirus 2]ABG25631.1 ORF39 [Ranid herpesvirus 2]